MAGGHAAELRLHPAVPKRLEPVWAGMAPPARRRHPLVPAIFVTWPGSPPPPFRQDQRPLISPRPRVFCLGDQLGQQSFEFGGGAMQQLHGHSLERLKGEDQRRHRGPTQAQRWSIGRVDRCDPAPVVTCHTGIHPEVLALEPPVPLIPVCHVPVCPAPCCAGGHADGTQHMDCSQESCSLGEVTSASRSRYILPSCPPAPSVSSGHALRMGDRRCLDSGNGDARVPRRLQRRWSRRRRSSWSSGTPRPR